MVFPQHSLNAGLVGSFLQGTVLSDLLNQARCLPSTPFAHRGLFTGGALAAGVGATSHVSADIHAALAYGCGLVPQGDDTAAG